MNLRFPSIRRLPAVLVSCAFLGAPVFGQGDRYAGPEWALLDAGQEMSAAAAMTLGALPDCDTATVDERILEIYHPDGTSESQDETYSKLLTEKGRRENNILKEGFLLPYFTVSVVRLEILKPDGRTVPVNVAANSSESIDSSQMQENIYDPNSRILQVNIPGLEVGDVVHSVVRTTTRRPIIQNAFADSFLFEGPEYVRHLSCEVRSPDALPLKRLALRDPVRGTATHTTRSEGGVTIEHWELNRVPRMYDEPNMPPYETVLQRLLVSTLPDWPAVSRWYWGLSRSHLTATTPEMAKTVEELTAGASSGMDRISALFFYVSRNIRYMGVTPEKDRPGFEPHDVKLTFAKKYGVCRDKAALLISMLRMAGQKAYPVLINVGSKLDRDVPSPDFNHAIVAVETAPDHYLLMDPTDEHTGVLLPSYDDNQSYLVCRPEGDVLRTSAVTPASGNMMRISTSATLSAEGVLKATASLAFGGVNDDAYRGAFAQMKPDDRRRFFEERLQRAIPGARLTSLEITPENMLDQSAPLTARLGFSAGEMAAFGSKEAIVSVPWIGRVFGVANFILDGTGLEKRKYPLITESTAGVEETVSLKLDGGFGAAVSLPSATDVRSDGIGYRRSFTYGDNALACTKTLALDTVEFSPAQYLALKRTLSDFDYDERKAPVLAMSRIPPRTTLAAAPEGAPPPVGSNSEILQDDQTLTIKDARTAVLRIRYVKKILTYAGKIQESEVKIPFNPSTQEVRLVHATVTSASGQRQEASPDEVNLMDAAWNASANRYTGGKIFVDSLPGVDVGSTIEVEVEITSHGAPFIADFTSFQLPDRLAYKSFRIVAPDGVPFRTRVSGPSGSLSERRTDQGGTQVLVWSARDVGALAQEPNLPPPWYYQAGVGYVVGDSDADLAAIQKAMLVHSAAGIRAAAAARTLTAGAKSRLEAVRAIRDYVATTIRVAGPRFSDLPLSELSDADRTLADGYGHFADRAILLHSMLSAAGFQPRFVLASDLPAVDGLSRIARSFPMPDAFLAPLVRVTVDGRAYYLNDTDQYARLGSTPHDGRIGLVLGGSYETIRAIPECRTRTDVAYSLSFSDSGKATIGIEKRYYGTVFNQQRRRFAELRPEERARYFQEAVSRVAQGAKPVGSLATDFEGYPGIERFTVEIDRYGIADGRFFYFNLPGMAPRLLPADTGRRTLPLLAGDDTGTNIEATIALPPGYRDILIAPQNQEFEGPDRAGTARIVSRKSPGTCTITYRLERRPAIIAPSEYPAALKVESALENKAARELLLESSEAPHQAGL